MTNKPTTEAESLYNDLQDMEVLDLLKNINREDAKVSEAVKESVSQIEALINAIYERMSQGGRLFYIGSGTSGRLGIVDASECPPTFGVPHDLVIGIISGGDGAIRKAVEFAEDDTKQGWKDILTYKPTKKDAVIGIAASGRTPYVIGAVNDANEKGLLTGCIVCNKETQLADVVQYPVEVVVGPEFVTGSTRMKAGTAQKLVLNMISTSLMIKLGHVEGNKMVDMQLSNKKLVDRGIQMIIKETGLSKAEARRALDENKSVRAAIYAFRSK